MVRVKKWWSGRYLTILIWFSSAFLLLIFFKMASTNTSNDGDNTISNVPEPLLDYNKQRTELYEKMSRDLYEHGAAFLAGGETSQSLSLSELFTLKNGTVTPVLRVADPPVRANVLYLSPIFSEPIAQIIEKVFLAHFGEAIWFQNASLYHFSMFHSSHHTEPVFASVEEVDSEARAVEAVARTLCPLQIRLERVVLTSTGVLLGCWQVINGTDPAIIRSELRKALPHAPKKQLYNPVIFHTTFARLLGPPHNMDKDMAASKQLNIISVAFASYTYEHGEIKTSSGMLTFFGKLVDRVSEELLGFKSAGQFGNAVYYFKHW
ncbi:uncharacterized protein LOC131039400 isoform X3 [Cryptomeria japonica]|uniref:uncharacterized protein LOC131039400 isoform X3 n=1 Tax=Cryptomeria japonica TaxID=3369 RepID=UPI0025ACF956|nr:uncharacterized protein LOC131039400 isoform X3 [Cryptomeria japonica]